VPQIGNPGRACRDAAQSPTPLGFPPEAGSPMEKKNVKIFESIRSLFCALIANCDAFTNLLNLRLFLLIISFLYFSNANSGLISLLSFLIRPPMINPNNAVREGLILP